MGMFTSIAEQAELSKLLEWVEEHKRVDHVYGPIDNGNSYGYYDHTYIDYEELVKELKDRYEAAEYD